MSTKTIKDPTFNIYAKGGNVENRNKPIKKEQLQQLAKDEANFDLESGISGYIIRDYYKERKPGQSITDWAKTKPKEYFLNIPLELSDGGKVVSLSAYMKQKRKPPIKKINFARGDFTKTVAGLSADEKLVIRDLLRKSGINIGGE